MDWIVSNMVKRDSQLKDLVKWRPGLQSRVEGANKALIDSSSNYASHNYLLSRPMPRNTAAYHAVCKSLGGYLVESANKKELHFLESILLGNNVDEDVALGVTDDAKTGVWVGMESGARMTYFNWWAGRPSGGAKDSCLYMRRDMSFMSHDGTHVGMVDSPCTGQDFARFVCEVHI